MEKSETLTPKMSSAFLRRFLVVFLPLAFLTCAVAFYLYCSIQHHITDNIKSQEDTSIGYAKHTIDEVIKQLKQDIQLISRNHALKKLLDTPTLANRHDFEREMLNLADINQGYIQIRWLDESGLEQVQLNFDNGSASLATTPGLQSDNLQRFFLEAIKLPVGELYVSDFERRSLTAQGQTAPASVLHIATPLFDNLGKQRGVIVLSYLGATLLGHLDTISKEAADRVLLVSQDGLRINQLQADKNHDHLFNQTEPDLATNDFDAWQLIRSADNGQFEDSNGIWSFASVYPGFNSISWKIVAHLPYKKLLAHQPLLQKTLGLVLITLILEGVACWKIFTFQQLRYSLQTQLKQSHRDLQNLASKRTAELETDTAIRKQTEAQLTIVRAALEAAANAIIITDSQAVIQWANPAFAALTGFNLDDAIGKTPTELIRSGLQSDAFYRAMIDSIKTQRAWRGEILNKHKNGTYYTEALTITPIRNEVDYPSHFIAVKENITERKLAEIHLLNITRVYTMLSNINQAIVHLRDLDELLKEICRISIVDGDFSMAWIGFPTPEVGRLRPVAYAGIDLETLEQLNNHLQSSSEQHTYPANAAFAEGCNIGCNNIQLDPRSLAWRHKALALGYHSMLALPIKIKGQVRGVYSLYAAQTDVFTNQEIKLLDDLSSDIAFAIEVAEANAERRIAEERWRHAAAVFDNTREGVMVTDTELRIKMVNRAFTDITGYTESEIVDQSPTSLSSGRHDKAFYQGIWTDLKATGHWQGEIWNQRKNGEIFPELLSISTVKDETGQITGYVGVFADISTLKASEAKMEFLAHHDPLTKLPNRLLLFSRLEHGIDIAQRENRQLALLILDLDRFKDINDSFGHLTGDELLQQAALRLTQHLRGADTITRLGGDEFTVLLEDINHAEDAVRVAEILITALSEPWQLTNGIEVRISVSVGISLFPDHGNTAGELLQQADAALYQAKASGRGCFKFYSEHLTAAARERIAMESSLRRALDQNEFCLYYQPQVDIPTGRIIGAEALLRWQDPQEGMIPPSRFIPIAETTGLICAIGKWVLAECCSQGMQWIQAGLPEFTLAVNVSSHQFLQKGLVETVAQTLADSGFPAICLELELTESALMTRENEAVETLNSLRDLGVRLALDDFGTGYSSLAYLKRFPLDVLKIDKSFVDDIPDSQDDREIAATIIAMAHTLRFKVLAEGVETQAQLAFLQEQGCDAYQGYWKSPPLPANEFAKLLEHSV
ncbi:MAG: hypothetical protein CTY19_04565 [Methylomonas sp.]|nr:MAG: hypothetical protein CTY19_04565 [Methylomonas sp.]